MAGRRDFHEEIEVHGEPDCPQDFNRYTYVGNNPLSFNDPSGLCFLGCFWKNPIFVAVLSIAIAIFVPFAIAGFSFAVFTAGTLSSIAAMGLGGALAGAVSAGLTGGNVLQGALFGGLTAALMAGMAPALGRAFTPMFAALGKVAPFVGRFIGAGLVGGLMSSVEGGHFMSGFLAAGVGSLGGALGGGQFDAGKMFVSAALGGAASVLGGGKFANGALSAAFAYVVSNLATDSEVEGHEIGGSRYAPSKLIATWYVAGTEADAAESAFDAASQQPLFHSREYGGDLIPVYADGLILGYQINMYEGGIGNFGFPANSGMTAWWHTHPWDPVNAAANESLTDYKGAGCGGSTQCDVQQVEKLEASPGFHSVIGSYLLTPSSILKFYPNAGTSMSYQTLPYTGPMIH